MCKCKQTLINGNMAVCRLCSGSEQLLDVFHSQLTHAHQLRLSIFLATGIPIKETDTVSKMVCHRCCEIVLKLHWYRSKAVSNDKLLKEQNGQAYEPPMINTGEIVRQASIIVSEQMLVLNQNRSSSENAEIAYTSVGTSTEDLETSPLLIDVVLDTEPCTNQNCRDETVPKVPVYKHPSIQELSKQYESIIFPEVVLKSNVFPEIPLNSSEVTNWYAEQAKLIQKRLPKVVIKKVSSRSTSAIPSFLNSEANIVEPKIVESRPKIVDPKPDNAGPKTAIIPVPSVPNSSNEPSLSTNHLTSSDPSDSTTSDDVSVDMNKEQSTCTYQKENDSSKVNIISNMLVAHGHTEIKETAQEVLQESIPITKRVTPKDKSSRKLLSLRKRPVENDPVNIDDDDEDEVIPKKKNRSLDNADWRRKHRMMPYNTRHSETLPAPETVRAEAPTAYYESIPMGSSSVKVTTLPNPITTTPSRQPWYLQLASTPSTVESSIPFNAITPPPTPENAPPLDHVDSQNILNSEKTQSVFVCPVCHKLCNNRKHLSEHEKTHLSCKLCNVRVKNVKSLIDHLRENCVVNIVKNPPHLKLTKVENVQAMVQKYPAAFDELIEKSGDSNDLDSIIESAAEYSVSDNQFVECTKIVSIGQQPTIINDYAQNAMYSNNLGVISTEVEVVCLTDESDDEIELSKIPRHPIVNNPLFNSCATVDESNRGSIIDSTSRKHYGQEDVMLSNLPKADYAINDRSSAIMNGISSIASTSAVAPPKMNFSPGLLNYSSEKERRVINTLFKKYSCSSIMTDNGSQTSTAQKNQIRFTNKKVILDKLVPELQTYNIPVHFQSSSRISAQFQEQPVQKQITTVNSWPSISPISLRKPHLSYPINRNVLYNGNNLSGTSNTSTSSSQAVDTSPLKSDSVSKNVAKSVVPVINSNMQSSLVAAPKSNSVNAQNSVANSPSTMFPQNNHSRRSVAPVINTTNQSSLKMPSALPATANNSVIIHNSVTNAASSVFPQNNHSKRSVAPMINSNNQSSLLTPSALPAAPNSNSDITKRFVTSGPSSTSPQNNHSSPSNLVPYQLPNILSKSRQLTNNVYNINNQNHLRLSKLSSTAPNNNVNGNVFQKSAPAPYTSMDHTLVCQYPQAAYFSNVTPYQTLNNTASNMIDSVPTNQRNENVIQINNNIINVSKYVTVAPNVALSPSGQPPPPMFQKMQMQYSTQQYSLTNNTTSNDTAQVQNGMLTLNEFWEISKF